MLLYIHIPFCASKCGYCAFNSFVDSELMEAYVHALCADIERTLWAYGQERKKAWGGAHGKAHGEARGQKPRLDSVFFGGGTPNFLPARYYERIFASIHAHAHLSEDCEISLEANVNLIDLAWCRALRDLGANRLSIGVQSFDENKLKFLERDHCVGDIARSFELAHTAGFDNLSCDLILPTSLDSEKSIESELFHATTLPISHLSVYALSLDPGSRFYQQRSGAKLHDFETEERLCFHAREILKSWGFWQYEVSNYVRGARGVSGERGEWREHREWGEPSPSEHCLTNLRICAHNLGYWQGREYLGCGAGAIGRVGLERVRALPSLSEYIKAPHKRLVESLSFADLAQEHLMLGLRCTWGADMDFIAYALAEGDERGKEEVRGRLDSVIAPLLEGGERGESGESAKCTLVNRASLHASATPSVQNLAQNPIQNPTQNLSKCSTQTPPLHAPHVRQTPHLVARDMFLSDEISAWILSRL